MLSFHFQNFNATFLLISKPQNMLAATFFVVCVLLNTSFVLSFAAYLVIASVAQMFFYFNLKNHYSCFPFNFLTIGDLLYLS